MSQFFLDPRSRQIKPTFWCTNPVNTCCSGNFASFSRKRPFEGETLRLRVRAKENPKQWQFTLAKKSIRKFSNIRTNSRSSSRISSVENEFFRVFDKNFVPGTVSSNAVAKKKNLTVHRAWNVKAKGNATTRLWAIKPRALRSKVFFTSKNKIRSHRIEKKNQHSEKISISNFGKFWISSWQMQISYEFLLRSTVIRRNPGDFNFNGKLLQEFPHYLLSWKIR